jgi:PIN domain nuclease of toxin-antitoxin system
MQLAVRDRSDSTKAQAQIESFDLAVVDFTKRQSLFTAQFWPQTKQYGLSLGDRACLALAKERELPVLTTDRVWSKLNLGIKIEVVR